MQKRDFYYSIVPNSTHDDYVCNISIFGKQFPYSQISRSVVSNGFENTKSFFDNTTGEILFEISSNGISENNTKVYNYLNCCEFAKNKNMPRKKIKAGKKHIIELCKENSDYLQASTGSSHDKRGIITVDIDINLPDNVDGKTQIEQYVIGFLEKRFNIVNALGLPLPTSYQIHLTNGHVQLFWVLEKEITIKKLNRKTIYDKNIEREWLYLENTFMWEKYMRVLRFLNVIFGGDPAFTGWQIKNMFLSDEIFKSSFKTIWNNKSSWSENEPKKLLKHDFYMMHELVMSYIEDPKSKKFDILCNCLTNVGIDQIRLKKFICGELLFDRQDIIRYGVKVDKNRKSDINLGRNQFVRMKTFEIIRAYDNKIPMNKCKVIVRQLLENALREHGTLKGTKNKGSYTDKDFDRDFYATYRYANLTYDKKKCGSGYTDEQRERAEKQKRAKKNARLCILLAFLEENPNLIADNSKNCEELRKLFSDYGITIKSNNTISSYKRQLSIKKDQKKLSPKNYKKADKGFDERIARQNELNQAFEKQNKMFTHMQRQAWLRRINNLDISKKENSFKRRKRLSLKYHTIKLDTKTKLCIKANPQLYKKEIPVYTKQIIKNLVQKTSCVQKN